MEETGEKVCDKRDWFECAISIEERFVSRHSIVRCHCNNVDVK